MNAERDAQRTAITREELCALSWRFSDGLQRPRFQPNGKLHMELYPLMMWSINANGSVQVNNFPEHVVHRTKDWGWFIFNRNIAFMSGEAKEKGEREGGRSQRSCSSFGGGRSVTTHLLLFRSVCPIVPPATPC